MRTPLLLLVSLSALLNISAHAEIYKTTDKQGRTVYTDQPAASDTKAKVVELPTINQLPPTSTQMTDDTDDQEIATPDIAYQIDILSPASGARLLANERNLTVSISLNRYLEKDHRFAYYFNGEKVSETTETTFTLNEPPRGENKIYVEVIDQEGKVLHQSPSVTVYVMRPVAK